MKVKVVQMLWVKGVGTLAIKIKQISKVQI